MKISILIICLIIGGFLLFKTIKVTNNPCNDAIIAEGNDTLSETNEASESNEANETNEVSEINELSEINEANEESVNSNDMQIGEIPSTGSVPGNTMSNIANSGTMASDGEWHYGSMEALSWYDQSLYKVSLDSTNYTKLNDNQVNYINIVEEWLYFCALRNYESYGIVRIKKDGTQTEKIFSGKACDMVIVGESIYFSNGSDNYRLYSMDTEGSNLELFLDMSIYKLQYSDSKLFFLSYSEIEKLQIFIKWMF